MPTKAMGRKAAGAQREICLEVLKRLLEAPDGLTENELLAIYSDATGNERPHPRTLARIRAKICAIFSPQAVDGERIIDESAAFVKVRADKNKRRIYYLEKQFSTAAGSGGAAIDAQQALMLAMSLYPAQRQALGNSFSFMMKFVFDGIIGQLADFFKMQSEIEKYVWVAGIKPVESGRTRANIYDVMQAIKNRQPLKLDYLRARDGKFIVREVEPYGLISGTDGWYMVGRQMESTAPVRVYRLDNIERAEVIRGKQYSIPAGFSLQQSYGNCWRVWTEKETPAPEKVVLKIDKGKAQRFLKNKYHASQREYEQPDGSYRLEYQISGAHEMIGWILSWSGDLEVLEPQWLRERVREAAGNIAGVHV